MFKKRDAWARPIAEYDFIAAALPDSVLAKPLGLVEERSALNGGSVVLGVEPGTATVGVLTLAPAVALTSKLTPQLATFATALSTVGA